MTKLNNTDIEVAAQTVIDFKKEWTFNKQLVRLYKHKIEFKLNFTTLIDDKWVSCDKIIMPSVKDDKAPFETMTTQLDSLSYHIIGATEPIVVVNNGVWSKESARLIRISALGKETGMNNFTEFKKWFLKSAVSRQLVTLNGDMSQYIASIHPDVMTSGVFNRINESPFIEKTSETNRVAIDKLGNLWCSGGGGTGFNYEIFKEKLPPTPPILRLNDELIGIDEFQTVPEDSEAAMTTIAAITSGLAFDKEILNKFIKLWIFTLDGGDAPDKITPQALEEFFNQQPELAEAFSVEAINVLGILIISTPAIANEPKTEAIVALYTSPLFTMNYDPTRPNDAYLQLAMLPIYGNPFGGPSSSQDKFTWFFENPKINLQPEWLDLAKQLHEIDYNPAEVSFENYIVTMYKTITPEDQWSSIESEFPQLSPEIAATLGPKLDKFININTTNS